MGAAGGAPRGWCRVRSKVDLVRPWCDHRGLGQAATPSGTRPIASIPHNPLDDTVIVDAALVVDDEVMVGA